MASNVTLDTNSVDFGNVPVGETAIRPIGVTVTGGPATLSTSQVTAHFNPLPKSLLGVPIGSHRIWITYKGTALGPKETGTITFAATAGTTLTNPGPVHVMATPVPRTIRSVCLVLDTSGSMGQPSGPGGTRMDALKLAAAVPVDLLLDDDRLAIVRFDTTATVVHPLAPVGMNRPAFHLAIGAFNPGGSTSIGAGVAAAAAELGAAPRRSIAVFTDGEQNTAPLISDVAGAISGTVYAIGLGTAAQLNPGPLQELCNHHNGYLAVTGSGAIDTTHDLQLEKYFLRMFAGVTNDAMIADPWRDLVPGETWDLPFAVTEVDAHFTVVILSPAPDELDIALSTPADLIPWGTSVTGIEWTTTPRMAFIRVTPPVTGAAEGQWMVRVTRRGGLNLAAVRGDSGLRVDISVLTTSALTMTVDVEQSQPTAGAEVTVTAVLALDSIPWPLDATVTLALQTPGDGTSTTVLDRVSPGTYSTALTAAMEGTYLLEVTANATIDDFQQTGSGIPFTRFAHRTVSIWQPRTVPLPVPGEDPPGTHGTPPSPSGCLLVVWAWVKRLWRRRA